MFKDFQTQFSSPVSLVYLVSGVDNEKKAFSLKADPTRGK